MKLYKSTLILMSVILMSCGSSANDQVNFRDGGVTDGGIIDGTTDGEIDGEIDGGQSQNWKNYLHCNGSIGYSENTAVYFCGENSRSPLCDLQIGDKTISTSAVTAFCCKPENLADWVHTIEIDSTSYTHGEVHCTPIIVKRDTSTYEDLTGNLVIITYGQPEAISIQITILKHPQYPDSNSCSISIHTYTSDWKFSCDEHNPPFQLLPGQNEEMRILKLNGDFSLYDDPNTIKHVNVEMTGFFKMT